MMKFLSIEKKALFSLSIIIITLFLSIYIVGKKNLWFEKKISFYTLVKDAEGLRIGSQVTLNGLRIGAITGLVVNDDNKIKIVFSVSESLRDKIREDSIAQIIRAMIIGDKRIDLIPGTKEYKIIEKNGFVEGKDSREIADLISGKNLSALFDPMKNLSHGIMKLSQTMNLFLDKVHEKDVTATYKLVLPTLKNIFYLTKDLRKISKKAKADLFDNRLTYHTLNNFNKTLRPFAKNEKLLGEVLDNIGLLTEELGKNPQFSKKMIGALEEVIVTLKAIQKTWMLRSHVEKIKKGVKDGH